MPPINAMHHFGWMKRKKVEGRVKDGQVLVNINLELTDIVTVGETFVERLFHNFNLRSKNGL